MAKPKKQSAAQAYGLFAASLALVLTLGVAVQLLSPEIGLAVTELLLILLPAVLFVRWKRLPVAEAMRWRPVSLRMALLSIAVGVTGGGVALAIHQLTVPILGEPPDIGVLEPESLADLLRIYVTAALLPGLCEETLFRGAIQGVLRRKGPAKAVLITALLFAVYHVNPWVFLPALFLGIVMGMLVERTGSTLPAILSHISTNGTAFTAAYVYRDRPDSAVYPLMGVLAVLFCVAFAVFWLSTRRADDTQPLLATVPAGLSRAAAWIAGGIGGTFAVGIVLAGLGLFLSVGVYSMSTDALEPDVRRGDYVVVLKGRFSNLDLEPGDIVSFRRDGKTLLRKVARGEDDSVWVLDGSSERQLPRRDITGKAIHILETGER